MRASRVRMVLVCGLAMVLAGCVSMVETIAPDTAPLALQLTTQAGDRISATYAIRRSTDALHFAQELGGYRARSWHPADPGFRWVSEGDGERIERSDGKRFDRVEFIIPVDYRALPKSYAPFSPFSEGSALVYSGQFHTCLTTPCEGIDPLPITVRADNKVVGVAGQRFAGRNRFISDKDGTNIFLGSLEPVDADGFVAIIDPGLPGDLRAHLDQSLPRAIRDLGEIYGPLSFRPELYVSIDTRPEASGGESTQGGTLPNQIFMHFDGADARNRLMGTSPYWLDWFFAHEAAHLFQQDKIGQLAGDDADAWIHEGGADAMAALVLVGWGAPERAYVTGRMQEAQSACATGLATTPLGRASAEGNFDLHYQCGLLIWLALDAEIRGAGQDGLNALNTAFFAEVRGGQPWNEPVFLDQARALGASSELLARIERLNTGDYTDAATEIEALGSLAIQSLARNGQGLDVPGAAKSK